MSDTQREQSPKSSSRRQFIKTSSVVVAGGALAANLNLTRVAHAAGDDVIRVGVIGCGGRGSGAIDDICSVENENVRIIALADAFMGQVDRCYDKSTRQHADKVDVPEEHKFAGLDAYQKVLASDCDMVIIATPPGFRPEHFEAAVKAGKHVFMEKPVGVDGAGIRRVLAAAKSAKDKGLGVGVGLQRRHDPKYIEAVQRMQDGVIGDILLSRVYWNGGGVWVRSRSDFEREFGHAPNELEYQVYNWYYFNWLCGDHIVEQHIHNIDVSNWVKDSTPVEANGMGGREVRQGPDHGQIFDHHFVEFTYPDGSTMMSQCRHIEGCWNDVEENFHGSKGYAKTSQGGAARITVGNETQRIRPRVNPYVQEHADLLASIRAGEPNNEAEYGAHSTMTSILGRLATYSGKRVTWDDALNSQIELAPSPVDSWSATPPVIPDDRGRYPVPVPGKTEVV